MRWKRLLAIVVLLIVIMIAAVYVYLNTYDYNKLKPLVAQLVEDSTGRKLSLGGEVNLEIGFAPALTVTDVALANVSWGSQPQMIEIEMLQARVRLLPLLVRDLDIKYIRLVGVKVLLETGSNSQGNWDFPAGSTSAGSIEAIKPTAIEVNQISIENLRLTFRRTGKRPPMQLTLASLEMNRQENEDVLMLELKADYDGQPLTLSGKTGRIRDVFAHQRFPLQLSGTLANSAVNINGAIDDILTLQGIDVAARLSGKNFASLGPVLNIQLPETNAFDVSGHLKGTGDSLGLDNINGNLSGSSINIAISGSVGSLIAFSGVDLNLKSSGKYLAAIAPVIGETLPATDQFAIQGHLSGSTAALILKNAQGSARRGGLRLAVNGAVKDLLTLKGMDLQSQLSGKSLAEFGEVIGVKLTATDQFAIQGHLSGSTDALTLKNAQGSARRGGLRLAVNGAVKDLLTLKGMDLQSQLSGKSLAEFGEIIGVKLPATDELEIQGRLTGSTETLSLQKSQGSTRRGSMELTIKGGISSLLALEGINVKLKVSGKELAEIGPLIGAKLPGLGPFDVSARLAGSAKTILLKEFSAMVDKSDLKGLAKVEFIKRPKLTIRLQSSMIDFTALMKSLEQDAQKRSHKTQQKGGLFSDDPLPLDVLKKIDADIVLKVKNIHAKDARLNLGHMILKIEDHDLSIDKLEVIYKETKISGNLQINAGTPTQLASHFLVQNFNLGDFLKETGRRDQVRAIVDIAAHRKSSGDSVSNLMANLEGSIGAVMGKGYLTRYLDMLSAGLSKKVVQIWKAHKSVDQINCAVVQFDIKKGVAASQAFVFDTRAGVLTGEGEINLGTEKIDFLLVPEPESPELSLLTKLRVKGPIMDPRESPDKVSLLIKGAEALSSLVVGPLALLAPFVHLGAHKAHPCHVPSIVQLGLQSPASK